MSIIRLYRHIIKTAGWFIALSLFLVTSCGVSDTDQKEEVEEKDVIPFTEGIRIAWDYSTLTRVYDGRVFYPRMIRLEDGELLSAFESQGAVYISRSGDEGKSWSEAKVVAPSDGEVKSAVPELIQLNNGDIILAYNTRPPQNNQNPDNRFGIKTRVSTDGGHTWSGQQNVYEGGYQWSRGVWEPALIQLPSGEIQLFFANEYPYAASNDQEISMVRSPDNGQSWTDTVTISYRSGHRDGMPVPFILNNDKGIAVAIEDNGIGTGPFKPAIIWSSLADNWEQGSANGASDRRWRALAGKSRLPSGDYGGAPYLQQLPTGETLLSFQSTENRDGDWTKSTMVVTIGDEEAHNFSRKSEPFLVPEFSSALWNSLFIKNDTTVTAVTSTTAYASLREFYTLDGYVIGEIKAPYSDNIKIDGEPNEEVWSRASTHFIGAYSPVSTTIKTAWDEEYLYVVFSVRDPDLNESSDRPIEQSNGAGVMLATGLISSDALVGDTYKILGTPTGRVATFGGSEGDWSSYDIDVDIAGKVNGAAGDNPGYTLELAIPWSETGGRPEEMQGWGINFKLNVRDESTDRIHSEILSGNKEDKPTTWTKIELLR